MKKGEYRYIWAKRLPFKLNFFIWKPWKRRIATDDNLKRKRINIISRYWCCENKKEEIMAHLFLTTPIATGLWRKFAIFAGIDIKDMYLQQIITICWTLESTSKLEVV